MSFSRKRGDQDQRAKGTSEESETRQQPADAAVLQDVAEVWQTLVAKQQDLAERLEELAADQHALANKWAETGDTELAEEARHLEKTLRDLTRLALHIEAKAFEKIEHLVATQDSSLRPR